MQVLIENAIIEGEDSIAKVKIIYRMTFIMAIVLMCAVSNVVSTNAYSIVSCYVKEPVVKAIACEGLSAYCIVYFVDGLQCLLLALVKSMHIDDFKSFAFGCTYIIGIPISCYLVFYKNLGIAGIWYGYGIGMFLLCVNYIR